jgi:MYXO-CTERM domain-containing protein
VKIWRSHHYQGNAGLALAAFLIGELSTLLFSPQAGAQTPALPAATCTIDAVSGLQGSCGSSFLQTSATSAVNSSISGATSSFFYYFSINSATTPTINVQVNYAANAIAVAVADPQLDMPVVICSRSSASSQAYISIQTGATIVWSDVIDSSVYRGGINRGDFNHCGTSSQGLWLNQAQQPVTIQLNTNTTYMVLLQTNQQIECGGPGTACLAWAYVDPQISVDPTAYPDATLSFSGGVSNATTPSATIDAMGQAFVQANVSAADSTDGPMPLWALGALGVGLLGVASRRLKRPG